MSAFKDMHKYYCECYSNDTFDNEKLKKKFENDLSVRFSGNRKIELLENLYESVFKSGFLNSFSEIYLRNSNITVRDVTRIYNEGKDSKDEINESTGRSRVIYCQKKINDVFKEIDVKGRKYSIVTWLLNNNRSFDTDGNNSETDDIFLEQLRKFKGAYVDRSLIEDKDLIIKLDRFEAVKEISDDEYDNIMEILRPYGKVYMRTIEKVINSMSKELGYIQFIMNTGSELTAIDKERRNDILRWLGKEEIEDNAEEIDNKDLSSVDDTILDDMEYDDDINIDYSNYIDDTIDENDVVIDNDDIVEDDDVVIDDDDIIE